MVLGAKIMDHFGIILETYLACILYSWFLKAHIWFFWKLPCFTTVLRHKGKVSRGELALFFPTSSSLILSIQNMNDFSFHHLLSFPLTLSNLWGSSWIWKVLFAPMGDLTSFSKPAFLPSTRNLVLLNISCNYIFEQTIT